MDYALGPWRLPRHCERIPGFLWIPTNLTRGAVQASGRKLLIRSWASPEASLRFGKELKILMDSNESQQRSRAGLWPEAFNSVLAPPAASLRLRKDLKILMVSNESQQGSRAGL